MASEGSAEVRLAAAQDACAEGSEGVVLGTVVAHGEAQKFLQTDDSGLLLVQVTNAVFTLEGTLAEICCTEIQLVSEPDQEAIQAFQEELNTAQARVVQSRSVVKKGNSTLPLFPGKSTSHLRSAASASGSGRRQPHRLTLPPRPGCSSE